MNTEQIYRTQRLVIRSWRLTGIARPGVGGPYSPPRSLRLRVRSPALTGSGPCKELQGFENAFCGHRYKTERGETFLQFAHTRPGAPGTDRSIGRRRNTWSEVSRAAPRAGRSPACSYVPRNEMERGGTFWQFTFPPRTAAVKPLGTTRNFFADHFLVSRGRQPQQMQRNATECSMQQRQPMSVPTLPRSTAR